jgi:prophage DNA circulation protein
MAVRDCTTPTYQEARWKGIPFHIETSSDTFGRRGQSYEYPLSEQVGFKDLGRKARRFKLDGYLIGADQVALSVAMAKNAESPEPGTLIHPAYGSQLVTCVSLTTSFQYLKEKRRTRLSFEFLEANNNKSLRATTITVPQMYQVGLQATQDSITTAAWVPTADNRAIATAISLDLATQIAPAFGEPDSDAISLLERGIPTATQAPVLQQDVVRSKRMGGKVSLLDGASTVAGIPGVGSVYMTFPDYANPIVNGTATVRQIHDDAMARLCTFNSQVVDQAIVGNTSVESAVVTARLSLISDYALTAMQTSYPTIAAALKDLDFVVAVYDEEEQAAALRGDDVLVNSIRVARATAEDGILQRNIRLPGLLEFDMHGVWPSLVCAQKVYGDGSRYSDIENYAPQSPPFFIGRLPVAPAY